jgi:hypothetical protein
MQLLPFGVLKVDQTILDLKFLKPHEECCRATTFPTTTLGDSYAYLHAPSFCCRLQIIEVPTCLWHILVEVFLASETTTSMVIIKFLQHFGLLT